LRTLVFEKTKRNINILHNTLIKNYNSPIKEKVNNYWRQER